MSESTTVAARAEEVIASVWRWSIEDERIGGFDGSSYAVGDDEGGVVLVDPHRLERGELERLGPVSAIVLTCGSHQRSAWSYRRELGVRVYAPAQVREVDEEPDVRYSEDDPLPAGLRPIFAPGPGTTQHVLLLEREPLVLFVPDNVIGDPSGGLAFVPERFDYDRSQTRETARRLLDLEFDLLCLGHGEPIVENPHAAIRDLLERDAAG